MTANQVIPDEAVEAAGQQVREVSDALRMIGEAFGSLTVPADSEFLAHKLVTTFNVVVEGRRRETL